MNKKIHLLFIIMTIGCIVIFCGGDKHPLPPEPKLPPIPQYDPPNVFGWEEVVIDTICLKVREDYYAEEKRIKLQDVRNAWDEEWISIREFVEAILSNMGIHVVSEGPCDAKLTINLKGTTFAYAYYYYIGGEVNCNITLEAKSQTPISLNFTKKEPLPEEETILILETRAKRSRNPANYSFKSLWRQPLLDNLIKIWGSSVAVCEKMPFMFPPRYMLKGYELDVPTIFTLFNAMNNNYQPIWDVPNSLEYNLSQAREVFKHHHMGRYVPYLVQIIKDDSTWRPFIRLFAMSLISQNYDNIYSHKYIVIPTLIDALEDPSLRVRYMASVILSNTYWRFNQKAKRIDKNDIKKWKKWWIKNHDKMGS